MKCDSFKTEKAVSFLRLVTAYRYYHLDSTFLSYLSASLCTYQTSCNYFWLSSEKVLKIPKHNLTSFGQCSFSFTAPSVWNLLPANLQNVPTVWIQNPAQDFPVLTGLFTNLGRPSVWAKNVHCTRAIHYYYYNCFLMPSQWLYLGKKQKWKKKVSTEYPK